MATTIGLVLLLFLLPLITFYKKCLRYSIENTLGLISFLTTVTTLAAYRYEPYFSEVRYENTYPHKEFVKVYEAQNAEFGFPTERDLRTALGNGNYNPDSPIPIDVDVYYPPSGENPKIFVTVPRFGQGIPYSLALLTDVQRPNGSELQPYPNYYWHNTHGQNCDGLTSVYRVIIDPCGQMWVLDSGEIEYVQHCAPQVVVFDLASDKLVHRYRLPAATFKTKVSRFVTPMIDIADPPPYGNCQQVYAYLADTNGVGIVVYDMANDKSWRIENKYTYPDPDFGTHTIAGESFELMEGAFGLTVTPHGLGIERMLYFHSLSNDAQVAVPLEVVHNSSFWNKAIDSALDQFILLGKRGVQCGASAMTASGFLLCGYMEPIGIYAWNIRTSFLPHNQVLLAENRDTLQFVSGLKVVRNLSGKEEVWILSNRLQKLFGGTVNYNEINFRIQRCGVDDLLLGKSCKA